MRVIVFDVDGTLANADHRVHHLLGDTEDWESFENEADNDVPHDEIVYLNWLLASDKKNKIVIVTARGIHQKEQTEKWLADHKIYYNAIYMREVEHDHTPDDYFKEKVLDKIKHDFGVKPFIVFEDRNKVVDMWRRNGIKCLQVEPGDF